MQLRKIRLADDALDDHAVFVHQKAGGGNRHIAPLARNRAGVVYRHAKGQLPLLGKIHHIGWRVVLHGDGNSVVATAGVFLLRFHDLRHLGHASGAAGGPKIHQQHLPLVIGHRFNAAIEQYKAARRRWLQLRPAASQGQERWPRQKHQFQRE